MLLKFKFLEVYIYLGFNNIFLYFILELWVLDFFLWRKIDVVKFSLILILGFSIIEI